MWCIRSIKRIFMPPTTSPIFFSDVILADILTSFAKVLGDLFISACQIWYGGITQGRVGQKGWPRVITLSMIWCVAISSHAEAELIRRHFIHPIDLVCAYDDVRTLLDLLFNCRITFGSFTACHMLYGVDNVFWSTTNLALRPLDPLQTP